MKMKLLFVFFLLSLEMAYAVRMVVYTDDPVILEVVLETPVVGELIYEQRIREIRSQAEAGDVSKMMALYYQASEMGSQEDEDLALQLLRVSETATAQLFLLFEADEQIQSDSSREFLLLVATAMKENVRPYIPGSDDNHAYIRQSRRFAMEFETLKRKAQERDPDAQWVLDKLELDQD